LFRTFSYDAYFHSAPSPTALIFVLHLILRRLILFRRFRAFSFDAYFHSAHSPMTLKEIRRRGKKMALKKIS
jgi:hypothetical protein